MTLFLAEDARTRSHPEKFGGPLIHPARIDSLRDKITTGTMTPRMQSKWNLVMSRPATHTIMRPADVWYFPENYGDTGDPTEALALFRADLMPCVDYAWRYLVNGNESDAEQVVAILSEYSLTPSFDTNPGSTLRWFEGWPLFVQAAMMVRGSVAYTPTVEANFKAVLELAFDTFEPIAYTRPNNWAAWGLGMEMIAAPFFDDRPRLLRACTRWRQLFDSSIKSGIDLQGEVRYNIPIHEIYRMGPGQGNGAYGLLYSNSHLAGMTVAAEYARLSGEWLFDHVTPDGSNMQGWFLQQVYWTRNPTFEVLWFNTSDEPQYEGTTYYRSGAYTNRIWAYVDILGALWPNEMADSLMEYNGSRPSYNIVDDYYGIRGVEPAYRHRPLYG
jgi:hypothetical protein